VDDVSCGRLESGRSRSHNYLSEQQSLRFIVDVAIGPCADDVGAVAPSAFREIDVAVKPLDQGARVEQSQRETAPERQVERPRDIRRSWSRSKLAVADAATLNL
jgi:hypothetical protein